MGSIIIDFPDCATLGSHDPGDQAPGDQETITVWTENCPVTPINEGPPPLVPWWAWLLGALLIACFIISTAMVRYRRHERLEAEEQARVNAQVEMSKGRSTCLTCGSTNGPKEK